MNLKEKNKKIVEKFLSGEYRLIQERNDFFLPQAISFINEQTWKALVPIYQRRPVWDNKKKSLFIESLILNVPVPPLFLFEHELGRYEIMDGQQRTLAISEFYDGKFKLEKLETWKELNGLTINTLPTEIVKGLARRRISVTMIVNETVAFGSKQWGNLDLRREVFSRLNSGGVNLRAQELRNSLYSGEFNSALIQLAGNDHFTSSLGIPNYNPDIEPYSQGKELKENKYYKRMEDCELVLRFFALRNPRYHKGSIKAAMDNFMADMMQAETEEISLLSSTFQNCVKVSKYVFGDYNFKAKAKTDKWILANQAYDAIMLAIDKEGLEWKDRESKWKQIGAAYKNAFEDESFRDEFLERRTTFTSVKRHRDEVIELIRGCL